MLFIFRKVYVDFLFLISESNVYIIYYKYFFFIAAIVHVKTVPSDSLPSDFIVHTTLLSV